MKVAIRGFAAVVSGFVLGSLFALPVAILLDAAVGRGATGSPWDITFPNGIYAVVIGFLTGCVAAIIFRRNGALIGALAVLAPAALVGATADVMKVTLHNNPFFWTTVELIPSALGGWYGEGIAMRSVAKILSGIFFVLWVLSGLLLFFYYWQVLAGWLGFILGTIVAFVVAPGFLMVPIVMWLVQGAFPVFYFGLLGITIGCALVGGFFHMLANRDARQVV